jgi:Zn-dependent M28 family amino/carboxypeptidase
MKTRKQKTLITLAASVVALAGFASYGWYRITQPWVSAEKLLKTNHPQALVEAQPEVLRRVVTELSTKHVNRNAGNLRRLEEAAVYIETQLKALGVQPKSQRFTAEGDAYRNIIVQLGPDTPEVTVLGAHYDVAGDQPGADDNASGVAGLLELVRLLKNEKLQRRVELVFYTNEEPPFFRTPHMGSAVHAADLRQRGLRASLMISLECIGYFSDQPGSQDHPVGLMKAVYPTVGNFIALVGFYKDGETSRRVKRAMITATDLPVHSINAPGFVVGVDFSDHLNYHNEGFVGMMLTNTAFYRNKAYHTPQDTADRLDYMRMAKVVNAAKAATLAHDRGYSPEPIAQSP